MQINNSTPTVMKLLNEEFVRRKAKNPRYSLRAMAKTIGVSHSLLSLAHHGKRTLSKETILKLSKAMDLSGHTSQELLFGPSQQQVGVTQGMTSKEKKAYRQISLDTFALISEWQHYAILSLLELPRNRFQAKWISEELDISEREAQIAMDRLVRLGLVKCSRGRWRQNGVPIKVENKLSTSATKSFHKQLLRKAMESLDKDPMEIRNFSSVTFAMDPKVIPYALSRIRDFRRELMEELEAMAKPKLVYNLTIQLFPVSKGK